jgi:dTDP-glucose 4,6-dehydratase
VFLQTNVFGTQCLLEAVRDRPQIRRFHQVSTDEVYGQVLRGSFSEEDPLETRSPYSATKAGADMLVIAYAASYGVPATITRGSNNIGPYQYPEKAVPLSSRAPSIRSPCRSTGTAVMCGIINTCSTTASASTW